MKTKILTMTIVGVSASVTVAQGTIRFLNSGLSPVKYCDEAGSLTHRLV